MSHAFDWNDVHEDAKPRPTPELQPIRIGAVIGWFLSLFVFVGMVLNHFVLPAMNEAKKERVKHQPDPPRASVR